MCFLYQVMSALEFPKNLVSPPPFNVKYDFRLVSTPLKIRLPSKMSISKSYISYYVSRRDNFTVEVVLCRSLGS